MNDAPPSKSAFRRRARVLEEHLATVREQRAEIDAGDSDEKTDILSELDKLIARIEVRRAEHLLCARIAEKQSSLDKRRKEERRKQRAQRRAARNLRFGKRVAKIIGELDSDSDSDPDSVPDSV